MPLSMMNVGTRRKITAIRGNDAVRRHLGSLGFTEGAVVEVVADNGGSLILAVMDSRVAIDRSLAQRILV